MFQTEVNGNSLGVTPSTSSFLLTFRMSLQCGYFILLEHFSLKPVIVLCIYLIFKQGYNPRNGFYIFRPQCYLLRILRHDAQLLVPPTVSFLLVHTMVTFHINGALNFKCSVPVDKVKCTRLVWTSLGGFMYMGFTYIKNLFFLCSRSNYRAKYFYWM